MPIMSFSDEFKSAIADIETRAAACGENWSTLCKRAGISRTTPDRWRKNDPATVRAVSKVQSILAEVEAKKAAQ
jgi:transposase-like protein